MGRFDTTCCEFNSFFHDARAVVAGGLSLEQMRFEHSTEWHELACVFGCARRKVWCKSNSPNIVSYEQATKFGEMMERKRKM